MSQLTSRAQDRLLAATSLSPEQVVEKMALALQPGYWLDLCPMPNAGTLGLTDDADPVTSGEFDRRALAVALRAQGYIQTPPLLSSALVSRMRSVVTTLKETGWPPVFAFVYDEFWKLWRVPNVTAVLRELVGNSYRMRLWMWCYYVHAARGARGWKPHADGFGRPGLSLWIPLADASVENGCMYVVPRDLLSADVQLASLFDRDHLPTTVATELLQCARPLPAAAGSLLAWQFDILHWGGVAQGGHEPRISLSAEFIAAEHANTPDDDPAWIPREGLPGFEDRLRIIAANIQRFSGNDAWSFRYGGLGAALQAALK